MLIKLARGPVRYRHASVKKTLVRGVPIEVTQEQGEMFLGLNGDADDESDDLTKPVFVEVKPKKAKVSGDKVKEEPEDEVRPRKKKSVHSEKDFGATRLKKKKRVQL